MIERIETYTAEHHNICVGRVYTHDGAVGTGQIAPYEADISALVLHRQVARHYLGKNEEQCTQLVQSAIEGNLKYPWSYVCRAAGGIDTALWDILAKRKGVSVAGLLGASKHEFPVYGSSMSRDISPEAEAERLTGLREEHGFTAFKIRVGKNAGHDSDQWPGRTESLVPMVRRALGDEVRILVDGNSCYTPGKAIEVGHMLQDNDVCHFEEPCPYWELEWTAQVAASLDLDVAGGEQDVDLAQWRRMVRMHAVDIVQPDICYIGGLTRALAVARYAADAGMHCVPHSANLSMVTLFSLHMMAAIENAGRYVEYSIEDTPWADDLFSPGLEVRKGVAVFSADPGWGVEVNPDWLKRATCQVSATPTLR